MNRFTPLFSLALSLGAFANVALAGGDPPVAKPAILINSIGMKLAKIPAGEFMMGSPDSDKDAIGDEKPQHKVKISKPFYMGLHTVTVGQFRAFVKDTGYKTVAETSGGAWKTITPGGKIEPGTDKHNWANTGIEQTDDYPVVIVDYSDTEEFCKWLSKKESKIYRLPTEAEWEYACRAGTTTRRSCGDDKDDLVEYANIEHIHFPKYARSNHPKATLNLWVMMAPVGKFRPNRWGLYDMHGNVWQWCSDRYSEDYYKDSPDTDPTGPEKGDVRVIRGGTWSRGPLDCRSANRFGLSGATSLWVGFRVVAENENGKPGRIEHKKPEAAKDPLPVKAVKEWAGPVQVVKQWSGHFPKKHLKLLPREAKQDIGVIVDAKTFADIWPAWSDASEGTFPVVDFAKNLVLFRARDAYEQNPALGEFTIQDGILKFNVGYEFSATKNADKIPAVMVVLPRQGIRAFDTGNGVFELPVQPEPEKTGAKHPPAREGRTTVTEGNYKKIEAAVGKWTEADVVALLGPAHRFRITGKVLDMIWEDVSRIRVEFVKGKATYLWGQFATQIPSKTLNLENFRKLREGMTEEEVKAILGLDFSPYRGATFVRGGVGPFDDLTVAQGTTLYVWQNARRITVQFTAGKVSGHIWMYWFMVKD